MAPSCVIRNLLIAERNSQVWTPSQPSLYACSGNFLCKENQNGRHNAKGKREIKKRKWKKKWMREKESERGERTLVTGAEPSKPEPGKRSPWPQSPWVMETELRHKPSFRAFSYLFAFCILLYHPFRRNEFSLQPNCFEENVALARKGVEEGRILFPKVGSKKKNCNGSKFKGPFANKSRRSSTFTSDSSYASITTAFETYPVIMLFLNDAARLLNSLVGIITRVNRSNYRFSDTLAKIHCCGRKVEERENWEKKKF